MSEVHHRRLAVLDHGYVELVESWGSDQRIIEAARMSTQKGFRGWGPVHAPECARSVAIANCVFNYGPDRDEAEATDCTCQPKPGDENLLSYLWRNNHATPFEFGGLVIEVKAPIMVYREWHRHRSQGYNEASARYEPLPDENYMPTVERCMLQGGHLTKQAAAADGAPVLTEPDALAWLSELAEAYEVCERVYQSGIRRGVPKELARLSVPVGRYSKMRATTNLRMWLAFLTLRQAPNAQLEIREYANAVGQLVAERFPRTWTLFSSQ